MTRGPACGRLARHQTVCGTSARRTPREWRAAPGRPGGYALRTLIFLGLAPGCLPMVIVSTPSL